MIHDAQPFKMADSQIKVKSRFSYSREVKSEGRVIKKRSREHVKKNVILVYAATADMWTSKG